MYFIKRQDALLPRFAAFEPFCNLFPAGLLGCLLVLAALAAFAARQGERCKGTKDAASAIVVARRRRLVFAWDWVLPPHGLNLRGDASVSFRGDAPAISSSELKQRHVGDLEIVEITSCVFAKAS